MRANKTAIRIAMANSCMNLKELTQKAGIPESSVKNVIYGRSVKPRTMGQVCRALGVSVESLLDDAGEGGFCDIQYAALASNGPVHTQPLALQELVGKNPKPT